MTIAHTPGPWEWDGNTLRPSNPDPNTSSVHSILDADGGFGFLGSDCRKTIQELDACRAVIAAAPDLLEALQLIVQWDGAGLALTEELMAKANAAIAKANQRQTAEAAEKVLA